jgi:hypothetical protein
MSSDHSQANAIIQYSFLRVFANDRTIDPGELAFLMRLALEDCTVDDQEKTILRNIFGRVSRETVAPEVWAGIERFRAKYAV